MAITPNFSGLGALASGTQIVASLGGSGIAGDCWVLWVILQDTTKSVTSVTDDTTGSPMTWTFKGALNATGVRIECWATAFNGGKAGGTFVGVNLSGTCTGSATVDVMSGVAALGTFVTATGTGANPSIALVTQDINNYALAGFGSVGATLATGNVGTLRRSIASGGASQVVSSANDNTAATPSTVTNTVTLAATTWVAAALELRSTTTSPPPPGTAIRATMRLDMALGGSYRKAVSDDAPRVWYRFAEYAGQTTAADSSGNGLTGSIVGGVTLERPPTVPDGGYAYQLDGASGYVSIADNALLHVADIFTFEAWIKYASAPAALVSLYESGSGSSPALRIDATGHLVAALRGVATIVTATTAITDTNWHHVVWTKTGATNKLYLDGVDVTGTVTNATASSAASLYFIGQSGGSAQWFGGSIDEFAVYATALSAARVTVHWLAGAWTNVGADVAGADTALVSQFGINGNGPKDRVADHGVLSFLLKNDVGNSAHLQGYYSPTHVNCRTGFTYGVLTRLVYTYNGNDYPRFLGKIVTLDPEPGKYRRQRTRVIVHDLIDDLIETALRNVTAQINQTEAQLLQTLIAALPVTAQPLALKLDPGLDNCPFAFDNLSAGMKAISAAGDLVISSIGYLHMGPTGVLRYENRQARQLKVSTCTFDNDMIGLVVPTTLDGVFNHVRATFHPKTIDAAATTVLWSQTGVAPAIASGASITVWGDYFNPTQQATKIGGTAQIAPAATTDYTANTLASGAGTDKTANVAVVATFFASTVKFVVTNNDAGAVFLTKLQCRGKGLYDLSPVTVESSSSQAYGDRPVDVDLPYQADYNTTQGLADYLRSQYEALGQQAHAITLLPQRSDTFMVAALSLAIGDRCTITEAMTGLVLADAFVQSIQITTTRGLWLVCTLGLSSTSYLASSQVWIMDDAAKSLADTSTYFGIA